MDTYNQIKKILLSKQKEISNKLKSLDEEESSLNDIAPESQELGTYSWEADTNTTKAAIKQQLQNFAQNLQLTLSKVKQGTYGLCDKCKKQIEKERLEIIPTANLCISCLV